MIWGCQWDAMLNFVLIGDEADHVTKRGNVSSDLSSEYKTGGVEYDGTIDYNDICSNIYDLEGNLMEWTQEKNTNNSRRRRGGYFNDGDSPSNGSNTFQPDDSYYYLGTRVTLYVSL